RSVKGKSQKELAAALGVKPAVVSGFEKGTRPLELFRLEEAAAALGYPPEAITVAIFSVELLSGEWAAGSPIVPTERPSCSTGTRSLRSRGAPCRRGRSVCRRFGSTLAALRPPRNSRWRQIQESQVVLSSETPKRTLAKPSELIVLEIPDPKQ
ncbi:MAG TPA: helix-turn-helix transcriptional regulator, partial [Thermoanaerobaculia bacterium]|nr:helix-turn-helix transcriptional regulator [Thermoanaerobaculia bacterium]